MYLQARFSLIPNIKKYLFRDITWLCILVPLVLTKCYDTRFCISVNLCVFLLKLATLNCLNSVTGLIHIKQCSKAVEKLSKSKFDYFNPVKFHICVNIVVSGNTVTAKLKYYWIAHLNVVALHALQPIISS